MRPNIIKRLLVCLSVIALIGGPWAQAFAQSSSHPCTMSAAAAAADMTASDAAACNNMAAHQTDPGKNTSTNCTQNCMAPLNLALPAVSLQFEHLKLVFEPAAPVIMDGRTPPPELSPPIALV